VIVALDVDSSGAALALVEACRGLPAMFKVGLRLFLAEGPDLVRRILGEGEPVFLDLKLHDIPNTVAMAAIEAGKLGVSMLTVHGAGGAEMIGAAVRALGDRFGEARPILAAVTVLTSMDAEMLGATGVAGSPRDQVLRLAGVAREAGADGLVCSPAEVAELRKKLGTGMRLVTPGVRMPGQDKDDQKRISTPGVALASGADWVVLGRYIHRSPEPRKALLDVIATL
jgi:orotidine-5'-phosphate decarboxylase